ncbi:unnamed protein product [Choristocarpus tenellus]
MFALWGILCLLVCNSSVQYYCNGKVKPSYLIGFECIFWSGVSRPSQRSRRHLWLSWPPR